MKTRKALKAVLIWNCISCVFWTLTHICLIIHQHYNTPIFFSIAMLSVYGWMVNPFPILSCFRCLKIYLTERKNPKHKELIGKRWVWVLICPIITTVLWVVGGGLFAVMTGGV